MSNSFPPKIPESLQPFIDVLGRSAALALAEKCYERIPLYKGYGSWSVYVPKNIPKGHWIMSVVGLSKSQRLSTALGGENLPMPKMAALKKSHRNALLLAERNQGKNIEELAASFNVSTKTVVRILKPGPSERSRKRIATIKAERFSQSRGIPTAPGGAIGTPPGGPGEGRRNSFGNS